MGKHRTTPEQRFWTHVETGKLDECWKWTGGRRGQYGVYFYRGRRDGAHRVSYLINCGEIPEGLDVLHTCDNPLCVNPAHLWVGTHQENMIDAARKKRKNTPSGERCNWSKLKESQVVEIIQLLKKGLPQDAIAEHYGVTPSAINYIKRGVNWKHIPR